MSIFNVLTMIGGVALFLYGMHIMSEGLTKASGGKLKHSLEKMTSSLLKAVLLGTGVTAIIQSSTATTIMTVGFVNSGLMNLRQAIGVIMGANIGTTFTSWLISLAGLEGDSLIVQMLKPSSFTPILALIGIIMLMAIKSDRKKNIGTILIGFAVLMFGMETMIGAVSPLKDSVFFSDMMANFSNPVVGVLVGTLVTAVIQSSTASVGILQALCATGSVSVGAALAIVMGQNIGTCVTTVISAIGASKNAQRAALVHVYFNILGTVLFMVVIYGFDFFFPIAYLRESASIATVALLHTVHNVVSTIFFLPFTRQLEKLTLASIPQGEEEKQVYSYVKLDERFLTNTSYAVSLCKDVATDMMKNTKKGVDMALKALRNNNNKNSDEVSYLEDVVDQYEDKLGNYLIKLSNHSMYDSDSQICSALLHCIGDFERISDHSVNLMKSVDEMVEKKIKFSEKAQQEMMVYINAISDIVDKTFNAFKTYNTELALDIEPFEEAIDKLTSKIKKRHYKRLSTGKCSVEMGYILQDILTNCERIADHCSNIAIGLIQSEDLEQSAHQYQENLSAGEKLRFTKLYKDYLKKYELPEK